MDSVQRNGVSGRNAVSKQRVLVIGWDGATWDVVRPLVQQGRMPNIAGIIERGASGVLRSTLHPLSPQAWASFETGVNPGKHGIYDWFELNLGPFTPIAPTPCASSPSGAI